MPHKIKPDCYDVWRSMKDRCLNPNNAQYKDYGGRGISICERWKTSFRDFMADMGPRPAGFVIDRADNDGNYEPSNCRWVDRKTSQRNQRNTRWVTIEGQRYKAADLADISGLKVDTIVIRAERGLSYNEVIDPQKRWNLDGLKLGGKASGAARKRRHQCVCAEPDRLHKKAVVCQKCDGNIYFDPTKEWREKRKSL